MNKKRVIFLDRDGIINIDKNYVYKIEEFEFCNDIFELCNYLKKLNYELIVVTNQSGIGRGYYTIEDFKKLTNWMISQFNKQKIELLDIFYCPHAPEENCTCRKPKTGMIEKAKKKYNIDLDSSWLIGDKITDIQAAINAKIPNQILVNSKKIDFEYKVEKLSQIKQIIKK
ncbi:MAG: D-glycero-beta-D-manno-heptose 1,7-bisphosphate 7-phosphatase [Campylobacterota bacterium]